MLKLLRLCLDYGEDRILSIKSRIPSHIISTIDIVRTMNQQSHQTFISIKILMFLKQILPFVL